LVAGLVYIHFSGKDQSNPNIIGAIYSSKIALGDWGVGRLGDLRV